MAFITIVESKSNRTKCSCCGEVIQTCTKFSRIEGEKYCHTGNCHTYYLPKNHVVEEPVDREWQAEMERETFARYQAAGVSAEVYWADKEWEGR